MRKSFSARRFPALPALLIFVGAVVSMARADDRFSLAVGQHGDLLVFGAKGDKVADLPVPSISQAVSVNGTTSFQVSYGRDINDRLTAIIAPNPAQPVDLHFTVLSKSIDADKNAVVTLTFSRGLGSVSVDPGYVGLVEVNSEKVRHHDLAEESAPSQVAPYQPVSTSAETSYNPPPEPSAAETPAPAPGPLPASSTSETTVDTSYTPPGASPEPAETATTATGASTDHRLFWSEPVTDPNGTAPEVGSNQMKLVEVQGAVSVRTPGGDLHDGSEGMIVPSGSNVSTADGGSAAVFIGGVDSVRLLPDSDISITHHFDGSVRHTTVNLHRGTVFSRVGHRAGETQRYEVVTPQGMSLARGTEFADALSNGAHFLFVEKGTVGMYINDPQFVGDVSGDGGQDIGIGSMPPTPGGKQVLMQILLALQPFNTKTNLVLFHIHNGTATSAELAFYAAAMHGALFNGGFPGVPDEFYITGQVGSWVTVALHDLLPFYTQEASKH